MKSTAFTIPPVLLRLNYAELVRINERHHARELRGGYRSEAKCVDACRLGVLYRRLLERLSGPMKADERMKVGEALKATGQTLATVCAKSLRDCPGEPA